LGGDENKFPQQREPRIGRNIQEVEKRRRDGSLEVNSGE
jgi:hypothetical protein